MTVVITTCRQSGTEFKPDHAAIRGGSWHTCSICRLSVASEHPAPPTQCEGCGRVLRAGTRTLCHTCLTGDGVL
jgi:hypothetical protein